MGHWAVIEMLSERVVEDWKVTRLVSIQIEIEVFGKVVHFTLLKQFDFPQLQSFFTNTTGRSHNIEQSDRVDRLYRCCETLKMCLLWGCI